MTASEIIYNRADSQKEKLEVFLKINEYNILNNTCVNFVWNALEYAGLNPKGFKGDNIPINNINNFEILAEALNSNKREEELLKIDYDSFTYPK